MPTYEYVCKSCGENLEVFQSFSDKPLKECPRCDGELQKVFHARGIVFKGSGFYATDSRGAEPATAKSDSKSGSKPGKSKSAAKAATSSSRKSSTPN